MKLNFVKAGINGEGIGYDHRKTVFCPGVLPGETAEIRITEDHERWMKAECLQLLETSPHRVIPACRDQRACGGCPLMCADAELMKEIKLSLLKEALWKYGHVSEQFIRDLHEAPDSLHYRSACKLPVKEYRGKLVTGMYAPESSRFVPVAHCEVHTRELEELRTGVLEVLNRHHIKAFDTKTGTGLRYLVLRVIQDHAQCTFITGRDTRFPEACIQDLAALPHLESIAQSVNSDRRSRELFGSRVRTLYGTEHIEITLDGVRLRLSPASFFQLNVEQALQLYRTAVAKVQNCRTLVETYCGVGAMSLMAKDKAQTICGIENVPDAIENAKYNASINGADHVRFLCDDAAEGYIRLAKKQRFDTMLADPPRSGMDDAMLEALENYPVDRLVYISCNPVTLAKNLKVLKKTYELRTVIPFDLFPQTPHVETVSVLTRRGVKGL